MQNKFLALLKSRKFWAAVVGLLVVVLRALVPEFPLNDEQVTAFLMMLIAYIVGVALEDGLTRRA